MAKKTVTAKKAAPKRATKQAAPAKAKAGGSHDDAVRMLKAGDWNGGLAALNALWATVRCEKLAAEIERLGAHAANSTPALEGEGSALQKAWEKTCASGALVGLERLLSVIRNGTAVDMRARFDRLRERAPDPRMTMLVPLFANELHLRSDQARAVWTAFFKVIAQTGDPRARAGLEKLAKLAQTALRKSHETFEEYMVKQIPTVLAKLPAAGKYDAVAALRAEVDALVKKPFAQAAKKTTDVDSLYEHVLDDPSDAAARQVWGDALLEAGDDRGTFVALQLEAERRPLEPREWKQHDDLLKANRLRWLGDAGAAIDVKTATFRGGVLDSAEFTKKANAKDLVARELRTATQLHARTPDLLGHENLVSLTRLGRSFVPNPHSTTGPVGFDYFGPNDFDYEETCELAKLDLAKVVTHLEFSLPEDCNVEVVVRAFPRLDTVALNYSWSSNGVRVFEPLFPWLSKMRDVFLREIVYSKDANDEWFVDRLPTNVHFIWGGGELYRSYLRRDGKLDAVFTDTSTKGGFTDERRRRADDGGAEWIAARAGFFSTVPDVDSLVFRQRSAWDPVDVEAVAQRTKKLRNVTLPKTKRA